MKPLLFAALAAALLCSCVTSTPPAPADMPTQDAASARVVDFGGSTESAKIDVASGSTFMVRIGSNPSTGYSWELVSGNENGAVVAIEEGYVQGADMPGAPGTQTFTFRAERTGVHVLTFAYRRPWETGVPPERTVTLELTSR